MLRLRGLRGFLSALFAGATFVGVIVVAVASCGEGLEINTNQPPDAGSLAADGAPPNADGSSGSLETPDAMPDGAAAPGDSGCVTKSGPIVFVTSGVYQGDRGKPTMNAVELDKLCDQLANDAGIARKFVAYVRIGNTPASARLPLDQAEGFLLPTGQPAFLPGVKPPAPPRLAINVTERCKVLQAEDDLMVWTGEGTEMLTCDSWTSKTAGEKANVGNAGLGMSDGWEKGTAAACTEMHHFYCFEQR
jgi:hypothetical protein